MYVSLTFTHLDIILILAIYDAKIHCIPHANEDSASQHRFAQDCTGPHWTAPGGASYCADWSHKDSDSCNWSLVNV